ncbi:hypothetical protein [Propionibacterium freudenreichii]|uniref:hypothetical protein n=1 Tax=Propionibacterium freudenreichii TaxID=1744 RepID=UPI000541FEFB|nr:hypothetical protein [Propionibacterium freudenreichii]CEH00605.1 Putative uncharacterized protein [Propionibacterium freudenreichii]
MYPLGELLVLADPAVVGPRVALIRMLPLDINPPVRHSGWLYLVALTLAVVAVVGGWALRRLARRWAREDASRTPDSLDRLRARTLQQIDHVETGHRAGALGDRAVHQQLSAIVRRFVGIASGGDADLQTLAELERAALDNPALEPAAQFVASGYAASFSAPGPAMPSEDASTGGTPREQASSPERATVPGADEAIHQAREVVVQWA